MTYGVSCFIVIVVWGDWFNSVKLAKNTSIWFVGGSTNTCSQFGFVFVF